MNRMMDAGAWQFWDCTWQVNVIGREVAFGPMLACVLPIGLQDQRRLARSMRTRNASSVVCYDARPSSAPGSILAIAVDNASSTWRGFVCISG